MEYFPAAMDREQSDAFADRIESGFDAVGYGLWAVEVPGKVELSLEAWRPLAAVVAVVVSRYHVPGPIPVALPVDFETNTMMDRSEYTAGPAPTPGLPGPLMSSVTMTRSDLVGSSLTK